MRCGFFSRALLLAVLLFSADIYAQGVWVEAEGIAYGANLTPEQAQQKALEDARAKAVDLAAGVTVRAESFRYVSESMKGDNASEFTDLFSKVSKTVSTGRIVEEEITKLPPSFEGNIPVYRVALRARVVTEVGEPDPAFTAEIIMKESVFYDRGDPAKNDIVNFKLWAGRDCYLYLFNIMSNDSLHLVFPNKYIPDNSYKTGVEVQNFEKRIKDLNLKFYVALPYGKESVTEGFLLIALKEKYDIPQGLLSADGSGILPGYTAAFTGIMNWLSKIPADKRTEATATFEIRRAPR